MPDYAQRVSEVFANDEKHHDAYYEVKTFEGPSLYFHRKSLECADTDFTRRLECICATLTAWGMHRMGKGGSENVAVRRVSPEHGPLGGHGRGGKESSSLMN